MPPFESVQNTLYCEGFLKIFVNIAFVWFKKWAFTREWYSRWIINLCIFLARLKSKVPPLGWWVSIQRTSWRNIQRRRGKTHENATRFKMSALILYLERQMTLLLILALRFPKVCRIFALLAPDLQVMLNEPSQQPNHSFTFLITTHPVFAWFSLLERNSSRCGNTELWANRYWRKSH